MISTAEMRRTLRDQAPGERARALRAGLLALPPGERDAWIDDVLGTDPFPADGPDLPPGCVPYLPCAVDVVLAMVDALALDEDDLFVDIGSGVGRVTALVHLLTGARAIGVEVQAELARASRAVAEELELDRVATVHGEATEVLRHLPAASVFFLYCPFSNARLARVLDDVLSLARSRPLHLVAVHLPALGRPGLELVSTPRAELSIYRALPSASERAFSAR